MFGISSEAAEAIRKILSSIDAPDSAGLRIATSPSMSSDGHGPGFAFEVAFGPLEGDQVIERQGAHVFLGPAAAVALDDKLLEVRPGPGGEGTFAVTERD